MQMVRPRALDPEDGLDRHSISSTAVMSSKSSEPLRPSEHTREAEVDRDIRREVGENGCLETTVPVEPAKNDAGDSVESECSQVRMRYIGKVADVGETEEHAADHDAESDRDGSGFRHPPAKHEECQRSDQGRHAQSIDELFRHRGIEDDQDTRRYRKLPDGSDSLQADTSEEDLVETDHESRRRHPDNEPEEPKTP